MVDGVLLNDGVCTEPTGAPDKVDSFDVSAVYDTDASASFTGIALRGDFLNAIRGGSTAMGSPGGLNRVLTFTGSRLAGGDLGHPGASPGQHDHVGELPAARRGGQRGAVGHQQRRDRHRGQRFGVVGHRPVLPEQSGHRDRRPGRRAGQRSLTMTVDGTATAITPGQSYSGAIVLTGG
jgi:hypothetical protein